MKCSECKHREWEEGDREHSPPGYGIYFCNLVPFPGGGLSEAVAYGREEPANCQLVVTPNAKGVGLAGIIGESHTTDGLGAVVPAPTFGEKT